MFVFLSINSQIHCCLGLSLKPPKGLLLFLQSTVKCSPVSLPAPPSPDPKPCLAHSCHQSKRAPDNEGPLCRSQDLVNSAAINNLSGRSSAGSQLSLKKKPLKYRFSFTEKERGDKDLPIGLHSGVVMTRDGSLFLPPECFTEEPCMHLRVRPAAKGTCNVCTKGLQCSSMSSSLSSSVLPLLLHFTPTPAAATPLLMLTIT